MTQTRVLLVEDSPSLSRLYVEYLSGEPMVVDQAATGSAALDFLARNKYDAVLLDLRLPDIDGMAVLAKIEEQGLETAVIVITAHGSVATAVDAMRLGATDFLMKPFNGDRLKVTLSNAIERQQLKRVVETLQQDLGRDSFEAFVGSSLPMQSIYKIIESAGASKATVFITGESGTGKELCAEAVHRYSPRAGKPFITLNCAAIPKDLMESEIFGHIKGAFTDATSDRAGAAELADGGTFFLDEICEMDLRLQSKLLRFIQTGMVQKVGGSQAKDVDVRFICATNRDPLQAVESGDFREDLYYRLHVIPIHMPPLRDRGQDTLLIAQKLLVQFASEESKRFVGFTPEAEQAIAEYDWPGNVRQLQNVLRNIVVLQDGDYVDQSMLPAPMNGEAIERNSPSFGDSPLISAPAPIPAPEPGRPTQPGEAGIRPLWMSEKDIIEDAIARCRGNIPRAAAMLEISASTIYRKKQAWEKSEHPNHEPA